MYLYKCMVSCPKITLSIKNPTKTWDTSVNISVFDTPKFGIAFTVKYIIRPPNTPPNNNL